MTDRNQKGEVVFTEDGGAVVKPEQGGAVAMPDHVLATLKMDLEPGETIEDLLLGRTPPSQRKAEPADEKPAADA